MIGHKHMYVYFIIWVDITVKGVTYFGTKITYIFLTLSYIYIKSKNMQKIGMVEYKKHIQLFRYIT